MLLRCRRSSLQIDVIFLKGLPKKKSNVLYKENKTLFSGSTSLMIERAGRDKDTSEQQLNNSVKHHQSSVFQCQVHNNVYNRLELTGALLFAKLF